MTREERLGLNIVGMFLIGTIAFYGVAVTPRLLRLDRSATVHALSTDPEPGIMPVEARAPLGSLTGRFVDERSRQPIAVQLSITGIAHIAQPELELMPDGTFRIEGLPTQVRFRLCAEHTGYAARNLDYRFAHGESIDLGDLGLLRLVHLDGRALDAAGRPLARARVSVHQSLPRYAGDAERERAVLTELLGRDPAALADLLTGPQGDFDFGDLAIDQLDLLVDGAGAGRTLLRGVSLQGEGRRHLRLDLEGGLTWQSKLEDEQGRPLGGARVILLPRDDERPWHRGVSDEQGEIQFTGVAAGHYLLGTQKEAAVFAPIAIEVPSPRGLCRLTPSTEPPSESNPFDREWQLCVTSAPNDLPLAGACLVAGGARVLGSTDAEGLARVRCPEGTRLCILAPAFRPVELELAPGGSEPKIMLERCERLRLSLRADPNEPLGRALVVLDWERGTGCSSLAHVRPQAIQGEIDASGELEVAVLGTQFSARILSEDRRLLGSFTSGVPAGRSLTITLPRSTSVSGTVKTSAGKVVSGAIVWVSIAGQQVWGQARSNAQGAFQLRLPMGLADASLATIDGERQVKRPLPALKPGAAIVGFDLVLDGSP